MDIRVHSSLKLLLMQGLSSFQINYNNTASSGSVRSTGLRMAIGVGRTWGIPSSGHDNRLGPGIDAGHSSAFLSRRSLDREVVSLSRVGFC